MINKYFLAKMNIPAYLKKFLYNRYRYTEIEGVPPITFQGIGENLLDYKIDGASGGVGDRTKNLLQNTATTQTINGVTFTVNNDKSITCNGTATGTTAITINTIFSINSTKISGCPMGGSWSSFELDLLNINTNNVDVIDTGNGAVIQNENSYRVRIRIASGYTCNNLTFYPMIRLATIEDDTYEPYGYKVPVVVNGKNSLQNTATTQVRNGVTFTINKDKSISCNGTASSNAFFKIGDIQSKENCIMSGCPTGGDNNRYVMRLYNNGSVFKTDSGNGVLINSEIQNGYAEIRIAAGYTCNNLTFYPMIRLAEIEDNTYEPYHEPTTTNIYLDNPIEAKANIPSEYEEVEYIESTGTQYIDTGFVPNSNSGFKTKIVFSGYTSGIDDFIIGLRSNDNTYGRFAYTCTDFNNITFYCSFGTTTSSSYRYISNMPSSEIIECELNYKNSNTTITQGLEGLLPDKNNFIGEGLSFYLAGAYNAKGIPKYKAMRQYKCELTQGTEVVRDLVPCYRKSDNVAGLYDLVNNVFYTNQGTGNFIAGPIKENESISLSDTNTNIPTIRGTNILTVDTTVQPSKVYIKVGGV